MEITQKLQPVQDKAYQLFIEVESQGAELEKVVTIAEQHLEGFVNDVVIQKFIEQKVVAQKQVEETQATPKDFEEELPRPEWLGTSHKWVLGDFWPLTKFWEILGQVWPILGLRQPVEDKAEIVGSWPLFGSFLGFGNM